MANTKISAALKYKSLGLCVMPISTQSKRPVFSWRSLQSRMPTNGEILSWFKYGGMHNVAIICGKISGNLVVLDFDTPSFFIRHSRSFSGFPVCRTRSGYHVYMRVPDAEIGNTKIAMLGNRILLETRGEGGYVLAPPSTHSNGHYVFQSGSIDDIPVLSVDDFESLVAPLRELDDREDGNYSPVYTASISRGPKTIEVADVNLYVSGIIGRAKNAVSGALESTRNANLFYWSCELGNLVAGGHLDANVATDALLDGAYQCGLVNDDGLNNALKTIESGIKRGFKNPIRLETMDIMREFYELSKV